MLLHPVLHLFKEPVEATGGSWGKVAFGLPCLLIANMVHSGAFFCMLGSLGAVVAGIMKGLQAVAVFILSATIYCSIEETQCVVFFVDGKYGPGLLKTFAMYMVCLIGCGVEEVKAVHAPPLGQGGEGLS